MDDEHAIRLRTPRLARLMAVLSLACAAWLAHVTVQGVLTAFDASFPAFVVMFLFAVVLPGAVIAYLVWLAAQLWFNFDARVARLTAATAVGVVCVLAMEGFHFMGLPGGGVASSLVALALLALLPWPYRRIARWIIERTGIDDPRDPHGHPIGHMTRVKVYCVLLGWAVFTAGSNVVRLYLSRPYDGMWPLLGLSPIAAGWLTYRILLWRLTPPTTTPLPAGGFEVIPITETAKQNESC